jgi:hypothetical protein
MGFDRYALGTHDLPKHFIGLCELRIEEIKDNEYLTILER